MLFVGNVVFIIASQVFLYGRINNFNHNFQSYAFTEWDSSKNRKLYICSESVKVKVSRVFQPASPERKDLPAATIPYTYTTISFS